MVSSHRGTAWCLRDHDKQNKRYTFVQNGFRFWGSGGWSPTVIPKTSGSKLNTSSREYMLNLMCENMWNMRRIMKVKHKLKASDKTSPPWGAVSWSNLGGEGSEIKTVCRLIEGFLFIGGLRYLFASVNVCTVGPRCCIDSLNGKHKHYLNLWSGACWTICVKMTFIHIYLNMQRFLWGRGGWREKHVGWRWRVVMLQFSF